MTSQRFSKNDVTLGDFKRSLIESLPFPIIAFLSLFLFMTVPVITYVTSDEFLSERVHSEASLFLADTSIFAFVFELVPVCMIFCGMLVAFRSFNFLLSKSKVNVYLSLGIKRTTMYMNRLISAVILLFVAVFIPMLIIYVINIVCFGMSGRLTGLFVYVVCLLFVSGIFGFALGSSAMMVSGNLVEAALTSFSFSLIPTAVIFTFTSAMDTFLKGYIEVYANDKWHSIFSPWEIAMNLSGDAYTETVDGFVNYDPSRQVSVTDLLGVFMRDEYGKIIVPKGMELDSGFILPVVVWFAVAVVLICAAFILFNHRKAENARTLGKFAVSRGVISIFVFFGLSGIIFSAFYRNMNIVVAVLIALVSTLVVYFIIQLILSRKFKVVVKSLRLFAALAGALVVIAVIVGTEFFGTFNKVPDKSEVKSVSIEADALNAYYHYIYPNDYGEDFIECTSDNGKEAVLKAYELLKNEKYDYKNPAIANVTLVLRDNDGKLNYRNFRVYKEETYLKYIEIIYGSEFFNAILENYLLGEASFNQYDSTGYLKTQEWFYTDVDMLESKEQEFNYIEEVDELCKALYKDLSVMTFDQFFKNHNKPVGVLAISNYDYYEVGEDAAYADDMYMPTDEIMEYYDNIVASEHYVISKFIPVYEEMTNTLKFLSENGYELQYEPRKIKEVLYTDGPISCRAAANKWAEANKDSYIGFGNYDNQLFEGEVFTFEQGNYSPYDNWTVGDFIDKEISEYDLLKQYYADAGHPLTSVTDSEEAAKIVDKTVSQYLTYGDNGRYVYVIYEEGQIVCYYLPGINADVVK